MGIQALVYSHSSRGSEQLSKETDNCQITDVKPS